MDVVFDKNQECINRNQFKFKLFMSCLATMNTRSLHHHRHFICRKMSQRVEKQKKSEPRKALHSALVDWVMKNWNFHGLTQWNSRKEIHKKKVENHFIHSLSPCCMLYTTQTYNFWDWILWVRWWRQIDKNDWKNLINKIAEWSLSYERKYIFLIDVSMFPFRQDEYASIGFQWEKKTH